MTTAGELRRLWQDLPAGSLDDVIGNRSCLILAPHPDDESLGCGGLIAACCAAMRPPLVVVLTDGSGSHPHSQHYRPSRLAALREAEATQAAGILGLPPQRLFFLRQIDTRAPHAGPPFDTVVDRLVAYAQTYGCSAILATWRHDPHCDHVAAARIADAAARVAGIRNVAYPVWGWTLPDDVPIDAGPVRGWRFDVRPHLAAKRSAIAAHASQYGGVITDDPTGFHLPPTLLRVFDMGWETFLLP